MNNCSFKLTYRRKEVWLQVLHLDNYCNILMHYLRFSTFKFWLIGSLYLLQFYKRFLILGSSMTKNTKAKLCVFTALFWINICKFISAVLLEYKIIPCSAHSTRGTMSWRRWRCSWMRRSNWTWPSGFAANGWRRGKGEFQLKLYFGYYHPFVLCR